MARNRVLVGFVLVALVWVVAGCNKKSGGAGGGPPAVGPDGPPGGGPGGPGGPQAVGPKGMFDAHCARCHSGGGGKKLNGPDLSHVGGEHDAAWIGEHIRNPKTHKPSSPMPKFDGKLNDEEIKSISEYLAGMK